MTNSNFETRKNIRAGSYTLICLVLLLFLLFFIAWSAPINIPLPPEEGMEVNLGNNDMGVGTNQPMEPAPPAPQQQQQYTPPKAEVVKEEPLKEPETDDKDPEAPEIKKPPVTKPEATKAPEKIETPKQPVIKNTKPVDQPPPTPPKPKALFKGTNGEGSGGNDADSYKKGGNEGIAGGKGDQGRSGGDPSSKNYNGGGGRGSGGISVAKGLQGRNITSAPSFEDDFNENGKVAMDIKVDASGKVISAVYQPRGSTTSDATMKSIAQRKAYQVRFNSGSDESVGTIIFNFKLRN